LRQRRCNVCAVLRLAGLGALLVAGLLPAMIAQAQSGPDGLAGTLARPDPTLAEVPTEEFRRILAEGSATVFDARPFLEYAGGPSPGARDAAATADVWMSIHVSDVGEVERVLDGRKDAPIVLYCNGPFCGKSQRLSEELSGAGFTDVRRYQLGVPIWRALGGMMQIESARFQYLSAAEARAAAEKVAGNALQNVIFCTALFCGVQIVPK
jgi:rhodanese-related sulfurtransferase